MLTLRQLAIFSAIAEREHLGRAAEALNLTQPAVSQQLRNLETTLEVPLFERTTRAMRLTVPGRALLEKTRAVLVAVEDLETAAAMATNKPLGRVQFGVTPTIGPYLMPSVIARLHRENPDLKLYIREGIPRLQLADLGEGRLDMMLSPLPVTGEAFHVEPLFREPMHIVAPPDHPLSSRANLQERDFAGTTFLTLDHRHHYHRQVQAICERLGATVIEDYEGTSLDSLRQMAASGVGLAVLPEIYVRSEADLSDTVRTVDPEGWGEYRSIAAVWRRNSANAELYHAIAQRVADEARATVELSRGAGPGR